MRKFIESVKDTIYDLNHFMWILIIIAAVSIIVSFQTYELFSRDYTTEEQTAEAQSPVAKVAEEAPTEIQITIPEGATYLDASKILVDAGIVKDEEAFVKMIQDQGLEEAVQPGEYAVAREASAEEILGVMFKKAE